LMRQLKDVQIFHRFHCIPFPNDHEHDSTNTALFTSPCRNALPFPSPENRSFACWALAVS
jgi:hypothetical protein